MAVSVMKNRVPLLISVLLGAIGISCTQSGSPVTSEDAVKILKQFTAQTGIELPVGASLIKTTDGGGRDKSREFRVWAIHAKEPITLPKMNAPGVVEYLKLPLNDTVNYVGRMMKGRTIEGPLSAHTSEWVKENYEFKGTIVRAKSGDHLVVERFKALNH